MFDTINFILTSIDAPTIDFKAYQEFVRHCLDNVSYTTGEAGKRVKGELVNRRTGNALLVTATPDTVFVGKRSLCKWYLGDNFQSLNRADVTQAINEIAAALHLPMKQARVTRIDVGFNAITSNQPRQYINRFGRLPYFDREVRQSGRGQPTLYYNQTAEQLCLYDKIAQTRREREPVPPLYDGRNVIRYEYRLAKPKKIFGKAVTAADLNNVDFYSEVLHRARSKYIEIERLNEKNITFTPMKTVKEWVSFFHVAGIEKYGGKMAAMNILNEWRKNGEITPKQAYDLRQAIDKAYQITSLHADKADTADLMQELDNKMKHLFEGAAPRAPQSQCTQKRR